MQRSCVAIWALALMLGLLGGSSVLLRSVRAQSPAIDRPGDAIYAPTKLEWAALELQATYGQQWTTEDPVIINFLPLTDGHTVLCLVQYTPDASAETVKTARDSDQLIFQKFADNRGWSWLRLQIQEKILPRSSR